MPVPSYDDLTPSIPDVHPRDTFDLVARLSPAELPVVAARTHGPTDPRTHGPTDPRTHGPELFACVRIPQPNPGALLALGGDFSPRVECHGDACVVVDVSGLQRLLGDAGGIAREIACALPPPTPRCRAPSPRT